MNDARPEEDQVEVGPRRLPMRAWEAEVLLRAAAYVVLIQAGSLVPLSAFLPLRGGEYRVIDPVPLCLLPTSLAWFLLGVALLRRNHTARTMIRVFLVLSTIALLFAAGDLLVVRRIPRIELETIVLVPLALLPWAYLVFSLVLSTTRLAFDDSHHGTPLAPLSSARSIGGSARAWAAYFVVWLTTASAVLAVFRALGLLRIA